MYAFGSIDSYIDIYQNRCGRTDKVWFYDMQADGYSLDDKRTKLDNEGDIPDVITRFNNLQAEANRTRKNKSFFVPKDEIITNGYDLTVNKYKEVERVKVKYEKPEIILDRIKSLQTEIDEAIANYEKLTKDE